MDDYVAAIQEVQQLLREVSYDEYVQGRVAANRRAGQADPSQRPSNVVGDLETDSDDNESDSSPIIQNHAHARYPVKLHVRVAVL